MAAKNKLTKGKKQRNFVHNFLLAPVRILRAALDFYTNTCYDCAGKLGPGSMVLTGYSTLPQTWKPGQGSMVATGYSALPQVSPLPRTYSGSSTRSVKESKDIEDLKELITVTTNGHDLWNLNSSTRRNILAGNRAEMGGRRRLRAPTEGGASGRSYSIGVGRIGRIDEDMPCDFVEVVESKKHMHPRCRSYAVTNRNAVYN